MLTAADLKAAVEAGILTPEQAQRLEGFAASRNEERFEPPAREERFRIASGLNDIFIALGVAILGAGLFFLGPLVAAAGLWLAAEVVARRAKLLAPSIVACIAITVAFAMSPVWIAETLDATGLLPASASAGTGLASALAALLGGILFFLRFRLPFAALVIAGCGTLALTLLVGAVARPEAQDWSALVILVCGLATFATAAALDRRDPERTTRLSDTAFWLHLAAAPMIVHSLIRLATDLESDWRWRMTAADAGVIFALAFVFAAIALLLDRRAILVAVLGYVGIALGYGLSRLTIDPTIPVMATLLILGGGVVWLGLAWHPVRRWLLRRLGPLAGALRLSPRPEALKGS